jgi:hypothetical protein
MVWRELEMTFQEAINEVINNKSTVWRKTHQFKDDYDNPNPDVPQPWSEWIRIWLNCDDIDEDAVIMVESNNRNDVNNTWFLEWRNDELTRADVLAEDWEVIESQKFKSHIKAADYIIEELKKANIEADYMRRGSCPFIRVPSLGLHYIRPNAIEPYYRSWSVMDEDYAEGLWPEEVVEKIIKIRNKRHPEREINKWDLIKQELAETEPLDPEVISLCDALNYAGFTTTASCSGHGGQRPMVWFKHSTDGRIEDMARFVISELYNLQGQDGYATYSVRIGKQIYQNPGSYDWSIEINHWGIYSETTTEDAIRMWSEATDRVAELITEWCALEGGNDIH